MSSKRIIDLRRRPEVQAVRPRPLPPAHARKERRVSPLRVRRRRNKLIVASSVVLLMAGIVYGVHWLSYLPALTIKNVEIKGQVYMPEDILNTYVESVLSDAAYHFLSRSNIFLYPRHVIENGIVASFPRVKSVSVSRGSLVSQTVSVEVAERKPFAQWCTAGQACFQMDDTGYLFAVVATSSRDMYTTPYVFTGDIVDGPIGKTFIPGHLPGMLALLKILQQQGDFTPTSVHIDGEQDFSVQFQEGFVLKASFGQDADSLSKNLELVLSSDALSGKESEIEYIDLRFGNRVYYKLKGEEQVRQ